MVIGAARHLALLPGLRAEAVEWPVPFADGLPMLLALRGRRVVMLASGDPFWFGAGTSVTRALAPGDWVALPAPSTFSLAAARLGWRLEEVTCLGLHAAPLDATAAASRARTADHRAAARRGGGGRAGRAAVPRGFGATRMTVMEALGGPRERVRDVAAASYDLADVAHPVAVALEVEGDGAVIPRASGLPDDLFAA